MNEDQTLLANWYAALLERAVRLDDYVSERAADAPGSAGKGTNLVAALRSAVGKFARELHRDARRLFRDKQPSDNRLTYYAELLSKARAYRRLHAHVSFLPTPWPKIELHLFVRRVFEEAGYQWEGSPAEPDDPWTILLSGDFNFSHILLPDSRDAADAHEAPLLQNVLVLPAAEKDNPLFWPNLVHELGHCIAAKDGVMDAVRALPSLTNRPAADRSTLEEWTQEIVADLIATTLLGYSYFSSFVTFAVYSIPRALRQPSPKHPSPETRIEYIGRRLRATGSSVEDALTAQLQVEYNGRLKLDHEDFIVRSELFETLEGSRADGGRYPTREETLDLAEEIANLPEFAKFSPRPLTQLDVTIIHALEERLRSGEVIATRRCASSHEGFDSEREVDQRFEEAQDQLQEVPNAINHIFAAATLRRLSYAATRGRQLRQSSPPVGFQRHLLEEFCKQDASSTREILVECRPLVKQLDWQISKSIESTGIVSFYQKTGAE